MDQEDVLKKQVGDPLREIAGAIMHVGDSLQRVAGAIELLQKAGFRIGIVRQVQGDGAIEEVAGALDRIAQALEASMPARPQGE